MRWIKSHKRCGVVEISVKCVPPWRRGRPKAGIDCPEGAELCRMVKRTYGITGKRSDTDEVNPATMDCASSRHSILRLWRGPSPRACSDEKNYDVHKINPPFPPTHFCFQTCSGGFAASIYRVMLESSIQVTSPQSLVPSPQSPVPHSTQAQKGPSGHFHFQEDGPTGLS